MARPHHQRLIVLGESVPLPQRHEREARSLYLTSSSRVFALSSSFFFFLKTPSCSSILGAASEYYVLSVTFVLYLLEHPSIFDDPAPWGWCLGRPRPRQSTEAPPFTRSLSFSTALASTLGDEMQDENHSTFIHRGLLPAQTSSPASLGFGLDSSTPHSTSSLLHLLYCVSLLVFCFVFPWHFHSYKRMEVKISPKKNKQA